jgi:hypothetical protein
MQIRQSGNATCLTVRPLVRGGKALSRSKRAESTVSVMPRRRFRITPWDCYVQVWPRNRTGLAPRRGGFARIDRHVCPPSRFLIFRTIGRHLEHLWNKLSVYGAIFSKFQAERQSNHQELWSGRWESNPRPKLGKLLYCHCTTPARFSDCTCELSVGPDFRLIHGRASQAAPRDAAG